MKKPLLFLLVLYSSIAAFSQQCIDYAYDKAGNRISRYPVTTCVNTGGGGGSTARKANGTALDSTSAAILNVFPNPTTGKADVYFNSDFTENAHSLTVHDVTGRLLIRQNINNSTIPVDLADYAPGIYMIRVEANNQVYQKKIMKE